MLPNSSLSTKRRQTRRQHDGVVRPEVDPIVYGSRRDFRRPVATELHERIAFRLQVHCASKKCLGESALQLTRPELAYLRTSGSRRATSNHRPCWRSKTYAAPERFPSPLVSIPTTIVSRPMATEFPNQVAGAASPAVSLPIWLHRLPRRSNT